MARYGILKAEYETKLRDMELQLHRERERSNQISFEKKQLSAQVRRLQLENAGLETRVREMKKCAACTCIESRRGRPLHVTESPLKTSKVLSRSTEDLVVDNTTRDLLVDFREKLQTSEDNARRLEVAICERNHTITEQDRAIRSLQHELATIREESEHLRVAAAEAGQLQRRVMELQQALVVAPSPPAPFDMGPLNARLTQIQSEVNIHRTHMDQQEATLATVCAQLAAERKQCSGLIEALRASEKRKNELESERNRLARILESQGEEVETVHARREVEEAMNRHMKANSEKYKKKYEELHEENRRTVEKVGLVEHQLNSERRLADSLRNDLDMARKELINKEERLAELDVILTEMHFGMGQLQADLHEAHSAMSAMDGQIHEMRLACQAYEGQLHDAKDTILNKLQSECDLRRDLDGAKMEIRQLRQDRIQFQIKLQAQGRDLTETKKKLRSREGLPPVIKEEQPQVSALAEPKMEG